MIFRYLTFVIILSEKIINEVSSALQSASVKCLFYFFCSVSKRLASSSKASSSELGVAQLFTGGIGGRTEYEAKWIDSS